MKKEKGFSLVEVVITLGVLTFIMMGSYQAFLHYFKINVMTNQRAVKSILATQRVEEWKSVKGENFAPGVSFPIYTPSVSNGTITFSRTVVNIPAVTQLEVDCTNNSTVSQNAGYNYTLIQGSYSNPGYSSPSNCWVHPTTRTGPTDTTPGNVIFVIDCPAGTSSALELQMVDYSTKLREQRVIINNLVKGNFNAAALVPPSGVTASIPLTSVDTSTGHLTIEIEQTGSVYTAITGLDDCSSTSASWTRYPSSVSRSNVTTPVAPVGYTETDTKCMTVYGPGTSGQYLKRKFNVSGSGAAVNDLLTVWLYLDTNQTAWFLSKGTSGGSSNTINSTTTGWQKLYRTIAAGEITSSTTMSICWDKYSLPNTSDSFYVNQVAIEKANPPNPNAVLTRFAMKSLAGFTDPDSTVGSPVPPPGSHYPYIITSRIVPTDTISGAALGWQVEVTVSKENDKYSPVTIINTINR